ncbi:hypothetical protein HLH34_06470 [Gluconacetobacter azotocaptans]|uniref:Glycosyl transferase n=1 Tax=Gluconacetobacter azotocaptans TaxID=142834 RepID=A0A7W4JRJ8_9PROT|nr:glycosyltransferase [Gluconacetobacter azotocaptans]MBB2189606.1 hypothetical protein [Gluconacetobacter azotocaptans]MBM9403108.1 hypothetical protein [Gluconacetobacter azotocaptans]GBQ36245.1 glycosyltransferase [Gluconacetobacter azotocaptans DSM 13594]
MKKKERAIVFTSDRGFIVPTLVAAAQIMAQKEVIDIADILIFLVDIDNHESSLIKMAFPDDDIKFINMNSKNYMFGKDVHFSPTHVPPSALARLVTGNDIPENYSNLLYLDGDIQIVGPIIDLVLFDVPEGKILAAADRSYIKAPELTNTARRMRDYLNGIGIRDRTRYFNSGVMACTRLTWIDVGQEAFDYFLNHSKKCRYHDQSALNAVCMPRQIPLDPKYNYMSTYAECESHGMITPCIIHFNGAEKPWFAKSRPWKGFFIDVYEKFLKQHPELEIFPLFPEKSHSEAVDLRAERNWKKLRMVTPWRLYTRRRRIRRYVNQTRLLPY